eukprot:COSAG02_NODE_778_length_17288_cov_102.024725_17_plen_368_part_00
MSRGTGYGDRRRDRSEGTVRVGSVWPIGKAGFYPGPSAARGSRKNHFTKNSVTPADDLLLDAAMRCDLDEVDAAIGVKANPTKDGPLLLAAQHGGTLVVQRLAEAGASVNTPGAYGKTPLMLAAEKGHSDVVDTLVQSGASLDARMTPGGQTALHLVGADQQCPLQMARMVCHLLLSRNADMLIRDQWGRTAEEYHRRCADLPNSVTSALSADAGRAVPSFGSGISLAPSRDGRSVLIADMIAAKVAQATGLLVAMQKLCWMRLLHRNYTRPEMSYGADSPADCITRPRPNAGDPEGVRPSSAAASYHADGLREAVYDSLVLRIIKDCHALRTPSDATLSRHIRGLRDRYYREQLPSYQVFTEMTKT